MLRLLTIMSTFLLFSVSALAFEVLETCADPLMPKNLRTIEVQFARSFTSLHFQLNCKRGAYHGICLSSLFEHFSAEGRDVVEDEGKYYLRLNAEKLVGSKSDSVVKSHFQRFTGLKRTEAMYVGESDRLLKLTIKNEKEFLEFLEVTTAGRGLVGQVSIAGASPLDLKAMTTIFHQYEIGFAEYQGHIYFTPKSKQALAKFKEIFDLSFQGFSAVLSRLLELSKLDNAANLIQETWTQGHGPDEAPLPIMGYYSGDIDGLIRGRHYSQRDWLLIGVIKGDDNRSFFSQTHKGSAENLTRAIFWEISEVGNSGFLTRANIRIAENRIDGKVKSVEAMIFDIEKQAWFPLLYQTDTSGALIQVFEINGRPLVETCVRCHGSGSNFGPAVKLRGRTSLTRGYLTYDGKDIEDVQSKNIWMSNSSQQYGAITLNALYDRVPGRNEFYYNHHTGNIFTLKNQPENYHIEHQRIREFYLPRKF